MSPVIYIFINNDGTAHFRSDCINTFDPHIEGGTANINKHTTEMKDPIMVCGLEKSQTVFAKFFVLTRLGMRVGFVSLGAFALELCNVREDALSGLKTLPVAKGEVITPPNWPLTWSGRTNA